MEDYLKSKKYKEMFHEARTSGNTDLMASMFDELHNAVAGNEAETDQASDDVAKRIAEKHNKQREVKFPDGNNIKTRPGAREL